MSRMLLTGEPGIKGLACDWLNGNLFWTNQKTESIYMQAAAGKGYATLLSKNISPSELVLLPVERCVWLLFSLCYTGFKSSRLKYYWYQWLLLTGKSTFVLLFWKEMSEHTWNIDVAVLKWAVKFDVLTIINAPAEMKMHLGGAHQILFSLPPSLMFWISAGRGDRVTMEKSWMDGSERSSLTVLTAQAAHSLTADVAARRLYWISDFKKVS